ncbi:4Fe-4S dicluster domain-containing protein, partial [Chloroflexota bacterium]
MSNLDLSVEIGGVIFQNPILPGSSDIILDERGVEKCLEQGIGGIVTKTFGTVTGETAFRIRPYHFHYRVFGKAFENSWITRGAGHPMPAKEAAAKLVPGMAKLCHEAGVPLVVSIGAGPIDDWVDYAKRMEQAGADMLELNFGHLRQLNTPTGIPLYWDIPTTAEIVKAVKKAVKVPLSPKGALNITAFQTHLKGLVEAGIDCYTVRYPERMGMMIDIEEEVPFGCIGTSESVAGRANLSAGIFRVVQARQVTDIPLIASGGAYEATDAIMYLLVGATLVEVCRAIYVKGWRVYSQIIEGIEEWMVSKGYSSLKDFRGNALELAMKEPSEDFLHTEPFLMPQEKSSPIIPEVDMDECTLCRRCEDFCLSGVFSVDKANRTVNIDHEHRCWGCGDCVGWCPSDAIKLIDKETKEVVWANQGLAKPYRP